MSDLDTRIKEALPGIPADTIHHQRQNWQETNIMRRIILSENDRMIEDARNSLENATSLEGLKELQGIIKGIRRASGSVKELGIK